MYEVIVLKEGYTKPVQKGHFKAGGSVTLLKGPQNIVVDTGSPWDRELLLNALLGQGVEAKDVNFSVCTSGGADKVGNLNLFPEATHIVASGVCRQGSYFQHGFQENPEWQLGGKDLHRQERPAGNLSWPGLKANGLSPDLINYVICSHGHSDHVGNLNLFQNSVHIVSYDICKGDQYIMHDFIEGIPYEIDEHVEIWPTPGHTGADVSVIVRGTKHGTVAVAGDLFECFEDLEEPELWQNSSEQPEQQQQSRFDVLRVADAIVPGHGAMFQVPAEYRKQMRMVMMQEERYMEECGDGASVHSSFRSECVIVETD